MPGKKPIKKEREPLKEKVFLSDKRGDISYIDEIKRKFEEFGKADVRTLGYRQVRRIAEIAAYFSDNFIIEGGQVTRTNRETGEKFSVIEFKCMLLPPKVVN